MKSIAVFCASRLGNDTIYENISAAVGKLLAERGYRIIYGGGRVGLMGVLADAALAAGGEVVGVIPHFLDKQEVAHRGLTDLIMVDSMHERKLKMSELSDAVYTLPGGFGTLEELTEMLTWSQLALHQKPIGILNVQGYYTFMENLFDSMLEKGFLTEQVRSIAIFDSDPEQLLEKMEAFEPRHLKGWLDKDKT
jgi:uncharacterized protein (TIGR00730 family)